MGKFRPSSDQTTPEGIQRFIRDNDIRWVDVQFTDVPGIEQHLTVPVSEFDEDSAYEGLASTDRPLRVTPRWITPT